MMTGYFIESSGSLVDTAIMTESLTPLADGLKTNVLWASVSLQDSNIYVICTGTLKRGT